MPDSPASRRFQVVSMSLARGVTPAAPVSLAGTGHTDSFWAGAIPPLCGYLPGQDGMPCATARNRVRACRASAGNARPPDAERTCPVPAAALYDKGTAAGPYYFLFSAQNGVLDLENFLGVVIGDFDVELFFHGHDPSSVRSGISAESSTREAGFTSSALTPSWSTMIFVTFSATSDMVSSR